MSQDSLGDTQTGGCPSPFRGWNWTPKNFPDQVCKPEQTFQPWAPLHPWDHHWLFLSASDFILQNHYNLCHKNYKHYKIQKMSLSHRMELSSPRQGVTVLGQPRAHHIWILLWMNRRLFKCYLTAHSVKWWLLLLPFFKWAILEPIVSAAQLISHKIRMHYHVAWCKNPNTSKE